MALQVGVVRDPAARLRVQVDDLALLAPAAPALPRIERAPEPLLPRDAPRLGQPPVTVHQQRPGDIGHAQLEEWEDVELVPEDMAPVGLAVQPARRDADVQFHRVGRDRLQQVKDVCPEGELCLLRDALELDIAAIPDPFPGQPVGAEQPLVRAGPPDGLCSRVHRRADRRVARRVHGHDLLDPERLALLAIEAEGLFHVTSFMVGRPLDRDLLPRPEDPGARRLGHLDV